MISLKKTLVPGMFSSISDAELVTSLLDTADYNETIDNPDTDLHPEAEKDTNPLQR